MFKKTGAWGFLIKYSVLIAVVSSIPMLFFIKDARFSETWLLYLGDALVLAGVFPLMIAFNRNFANEDAGISNMVTTGFIITGITMLLILLLGFIMVVAYIPGLFSSGEAGKTLAQAPLNKVDDKTNGMLYILILNVMVGNFIAGAFSSLITAFTAKKDQTQAV